MQHKIKNLQYQSKMYQDKGEDDIQMETNEKVRITVKIYSNGEHGVQNVFTWNRDNVILYSVVIYVFLLIFSV